MTLTHNKYQSSTDPERGGNTDTVFLLRPVSTFGQEWIDEHIPDDAPWFGDAVVVEHRYISPIIEGATGNGLVVGRG